MKVSIEKLIVVTRGLFIASVLGITSLILYPNIHNFPSIISNSIKFIFLESLIIYALVMAIKPCFKSIGIAMVLSGLIIPFILPQTFSKELTAFTLSSIFYISFIALAVTLLLISIPFGSVRLQITYAILSVALLLPLLQYSILNLKCVSCITSRLPYYCILISDPSFIFYIFTAIVGFTLASAEKTEALSFNSIKDISLKYSFSSLLPLTFSLFFINNLNYLKQMFFSINRVEIYLVLASILFAILVGLVFRKKQAIIWTLIVAGVSLGLAWLSFIYSPYFSLVFLIMGASVIPVSLPNPQVIENKLFNAIDSKMPARAERYLKALLSLKYTYTKIFCDAANRRDCEAISWIYSKAMGNIDYGSCSNLSNVVNCIIYKGIIPVDSPKLIDVLMSKDKNSAEKFASYLLTKDLPQPVKDKAKAALATILNANTGNGISQVKKIKLPTLEEWKPDIWVNSNLYGYKIVKVLGTGGNSYVLLGERNNNKYAIKIAKVSRNSISNIVTLFEDISKESFSLQSISEKSPNIVRIYGFYVDLNSLREISNGNSEAYYSTPPAIVMEVMEGGTAEDLIKNQAIILSTYWKKVVALISLNIAKALSVVHKEGYVHLDIKPSNIFFSKKPGITAEEILENIKTGRVEVKLGDLGSARKIGERVLEYTPQYCSIDQVEAMLSKNGADPKMDIYAFGATIYKLLTQTPFNPPNVSRLMDEAVEFYVNGRPYALFLENARKELQLFHQTFALPQEYAEFTNLIKLMTSPDPRSRPTIDYIVIELNKIASNI